MLHFYDKLIYIKKIALVTLLIFVTGNSFADPCGNKSKKKLHKAENYFDQGEYLKSMEIFEELLKEDPNSAYINYHIGVCKYHLKHYRREALSYFLKSNEKISPEIDYYLGVLYHINLDFEKAELHLRKYLTAPIRDHDEAYINQLLNNVFSAQKLISQPILVEIYNMGETINSEYSDYVPLITANGNELFFTSRRPGSTGGEKDVLGNYYEDIYVSHKVNYSWTKPEQLPSPVNTNLHDACVGLTPEGDNLLIFRTNENLISGDIFMTESDGKTWNTPVLLDPIINDPKWNDPSACFSPDGESIYFSSDRPGGFGGKDIYRSVRLPNGKWSLAKNLGENINTPFDEDAPFIHANGKELYFSSRGHENMGGYDIFKSVIDSNNEWSMAINVGYPLNTVEDDIYFVLVADGETGYLSSSRSGGFGETDIYSFHFTVLDAGYMVNEGYVKNEEGKPVSAKLTIIESDNLKVQGIYRSNKTSGKFIFLRCSDFEYKVIVEAEGYYTKTIQIEVDFENSIQIELEKKNNE